MIALPARAWRQVTAASTVPALAIPRLCIIAVFIAAIIALIVQYNVILRGYMTDDAFISFRYADNLARGLGPVWSEGERVEGYTNFGWVLLLAVGIKFGIDPVFASRALGVVFSVGTLALIPLLAGQLQPMWSRPWLLLVAGASIALALNSGFVLWTFAGLETTALTCLITAGITLHLWEERTGARPLWSSPAFMIATLVRPDAVVVWATTALFKSSRLLSSDWRARLPALALWAALFLVPFVAYWLWRWDYYGYFFPNTFYLRTPRSLDFIERGLQQGLQFINIYWVWLILAALVSVWRERLSAYRPVTYLLALIAVWFAYVGYSGGDWMPYFRFFIAVLPVVYLVIMQGAIDFGALLSVANLLRSRGTVNLADWQGLQFPASALATVAIALFAAIVSFSAIRPHDDGVAKQTVLFNSDILPGRIGLETHKAIGLWMRDNLPPSYTVALIATGIVPYYSRLPTLDLLGVNDEHISHVDLPLGSGPAGHEKWDGDYVLSRRPEIIWFALAQEPEPRDSIEDFLPPNYPFPIHTTVTQHPSAWSLYRPVAIPFQGGWLNFMVRKDVGLPVLAQRPQESGDTPAPASEPP